MSETGKGQKKADGKATVSKKESKQKVLKVEKTEGLYRRWVQALGEMPDSLSRQVGQIGNRKYDYTPLPNIINAIRPIMAKYGLAISQNVWRVGDEVKAQTYVYCIVGGKLSSAIISLPIIKSAGGNIAQSIGATMTYARRYSLSAFLGIATEEDTDVQDVKQNKSEKAPDKPKENLILNEKKNEIAGKLKQALAQNLIVKEDYAVRINKLKDISSEPAVNAYALAMDRYIKNKTPEQEIF